MPYIQLTRREVWKITERRDGCIWKTESLGLIWIPLNEVAGRNDNESFEEYYARTGAYEKKVAKEHGGDFLGSVSTGTPFEETFKSVKQEEVVNWVK